MDTTSSWIICCWKWSWWQAIWKRRVRFNIATFVFPGSFHSSSCSTSIFYLVWFPESKISFIAVRKIVHFLQTQTSKVLCPRAVTFISQFLDSFLAVSPSLVPQPLWEYHTKTNFDRTLHYGMFKVFLSGTIQNLPVAAISSRIYIQTIKHASQLSNYDL